MCCHCALSAVLRSCNCALKICCRTWSRRELHFLPLTEETSVLPLPASLSFETELTQFDIFNNFKKTCYSFPKSCFTVRNREIFQGRKSRGRKKNNLSKLCVFGKLSFATKKNKVKSKLGGDKAQLLKQISPRAMFPCQGIPAAFHCHLVGAGGA